HGAWYLLSYSGPILLPLSLIPKPSWKECDIKISFRTEHSKVSHCLKFDLVPVFVLIPPAARGSFSDDGWMMLCCVAPNLVAPGKSDGCQPRYPESTLLHHKDDLTTSETAEECKKATKGLFEALQALEYRNSAKTQLSAASPISLQLGWRSTAVGGLHRDNEHACLIALMCATEERPCLKG
ncbi:hypothetical protein STEG23_007992, partial [Scotinomys teguina]